MSFQQSNQRQSVYPDFRVGFLGFTDTTAIISVGPKEPSNYIQNVFVKTSAEIPFLPIESDWNDFYSQVLGLFYANSLGDKGKGKDISKFIPANTNNPNFDLTQDYYGIGGEFEIPLKTDLYFWVKIPASFNRPTSTVTNAQVGSPSFNGPGGDSSDFTKWMQIEFGDAVPSRKVPQRNGDKYTYFCYIPIFKINVSRTDFAVQYFDFGEPMFIDVNFFLFADYLDISECSSFYD